MQKQSNSVIDTVVYLSYAKGQLQKKTFNTKLQNKYDYGAK